MLMAPARKPLGLFVALLLFIAGVILSSIGSREITQGLMGLQALLTITGVGLLIGFKPYRLAVLSPDIERHPELACYRRLPFLPYSLGLLGVQGAFFVLSLILFNTLESMTQVNLRLQPLRPGTFLDISQNVWLTVHYLPWVLYAVLGVGMAYCIVDRGDKAILAEMILPEHKQQPKLFIHNYFMIVTEAVRMGSLMNVIVLSILWQCQALNGLFQLEDLSKNPFRTVFICLLIFIFFQKTRQKLMNTLQEKRVPLGGLMVFFALIISFVIFWLHSTGSWVTLNNEQAGNEEMIKSVLAGSFSKEAETDRWCLLMWGWWGLSIPWMSSLIARLSMGRSVLEAFFSALIFPTMVVVLFSKVTLQHWSVWSDFLKEPAAKVGVAIFLLVFMLFFFGHVRSSKDIARGGLLAFGKWRMPSFSKWLNVLCVSVACYLPGLFVLGWLPVQVVNTLGTLFITTVVAGFIWALASSKAPLSAEGKYRVQQ